MDSQLTGSNELLYVQTKKVSVTIKGKATHPNFQGVEYKSGDSSIKVHCVDDFQIALRDGEVPQFSSRNGEISTGIYSIYPMFYEQQQYEIIIEAVDGHKAVFWHDNLNVRNKVTRASRNHEILSGVINFGNEIGFSDLVIQIDGVNYLRLVIEVFPTKIDYQNDYKQIVEDVTKEVYNVVFDFLKKTYLGYQQSDKVNSSPVEFFAVISKIYKDFIKAADIIMLQPHHVLETTHQVLPSHKVKKTDSRTVKWIEKHPDQAKRVDGDIRIERALAVRKQISYDTKENRLTKYILLSTARKLESFKKNYIKLQRKEDQAVIVKIDRMVREINRRCNTTFLADVEAKEASSGMSLVFSMAPGYRELYKYYLMLLRGLSITGDVFNISVKDLALLYEYWCFIKLNSMMKDRYQLISQDIVKVQGNGLFVSLVKGSSSKVKYRNSENGELITLSYNPKSGQVPTVAQKPDNVLSLEKKTVNQAGKKVKYEYVFDAKYRVNPALEGSDYYNTISHTPGPETDDINTMHRYRDAIVYHNGADPYEEFMPYECMYPIRDEDLIPESGEIYYSQVAEDETVYSIKRDFTVDENGLVYSTYHVTSGENAEREIVFSDKGFSEETWKEQLPSLLKESGMIADAPTAAIHGKERMVAYLDVLERNFKSAREESGEEKGKEEEVVASSKEAEEFIQDAKERTELRERYERTQYTTIVVPATAIMPSGEMITSLEFAEGLVEGITVEKIDSETAVVSLKEDAVYRIKRLRGKVFSCT